MADIPDEKTIEELAAATRGRRLRRRWPVFALLALLVALLAGGALIGVEGWRQGKINATEERFHQIAREAAAEFSRVSDWKQWYFDQAGEGCGGDKFNAWVKSAEAGGVTLEPDWSWSSATEDSLHGIPVNEPLPAEATLRAYIRDTQLIAQGIDPLLEYRVLNGVPDLSSGAPKLELIPLLQAVKVPRHRALAFALLEDYASAWLECSRMLDIAGRLHEPASLMEYLIFVSMYGLANDTFTTLCARSSPPPDLARRFPQGLPPIRLAQIVERELAFMVQMFNLPESLADWRDEENARWFGWVRWGEDWEEWTEAFAAPWQNFEFGIGTLEGTLRLHQALRAGKSRPSESRESMMHLWSRPAEGRAEIAYAVMRANLAYAIRQAEVEGTAIGDFVADETRYSDFHITRQDGWYEISWDLSEQVKASLRDEYADDADLFKTPEPIRLLPLR